MLSRSECILRARFDVSASTQRILVVDDEDDLRECFADVLRAEGYDVRTARNGRDALEQIEKPHGGPCLVLLDMMMPGMDGAEVLRILREKERLATLPVVVVSAQRDLAEAAKRMGVRRVIRKPVSVDVLLSIAHEFCHA
jgi:CheY-like chemotaxis protein